MDDGQIGWIGAIVIGGIAGWLAEIITRSNMGVITNIILGVIGAGIAAGPATFQAWSPLSQNDCRCSPRMGCWPPPRTGLSPCTRTSSSRSEAVS